MQITLTNILYVTGIPTKGQKMEIQITIKKQKEGNFISITEF
jgi:hypothetical protein